MTKVACPCCGHVTLGERGEFEICRVCFWEDDGQDNADADVQRGGPSHISLTEGRRNYLLRGVAEEKDQVHVRSPKPDEPRLRHFVVEGDHVVELSAATDASGRKQGGNER